MYIWDGIRLKKHLICFELKIVFVKFSGHDHESKCDLKIILSFWWFTFINSWKSRIFWKDFGLCLSLRNKHKPIAGKGRGRKCDVRPGSERETEGGEEWAAGRATAFPFPGSFSLSLSTSATRTRLEDEDSLKATTAGTVIYFRLKSFRDIWNTSRFIRHSSEDDTAKHVLWIWRYSMNLWENVRHGCIKNTFFKMCDYWLGCFQVSMPVLTSAGVGSCSMNCFIVEKCC